MSNLVDVIIVGAGSGGAVLGHCLARTGIDVLILERHVHLPNGVRGEILQPNGQKILDELGILTRLSDKEVYSTDEFHFFRCGKGRLCTIDYRMLPFPYNRALTAFSAPVHRVLMESLDGLPTLNVRFGASFKSLLWNGNRVAGVRIEQLGETQEIFSKLVVGADGAGSAVRRALGIPSQTYQYPDGYLLAVLDRPNGFERQARYYIGRRTILGLFPMPGERLYLFYMLLNSERAQLNEQSFRALKHKMISIESSLEGPMQQLTGLEQTAYRPCFRVRARTWVKDGAVLIGDSAHAMNPHVSQGRMQAMEDAVALSRVIERCRASGDFSAKALSEFERERRPHVDMLQQFGDEQTFFWHSANPLIESIVDRVLRTLDRNARLRYQVLATTAGLRSQPPLSLLDRLIAIGLLPELWPRDSRRALHEH